MPKIYLEYAKTILESDMAGTAGTLEESEAMRPVGTVETVEADKAAANEDSARTEERIRYAHIRTPGGSHTGWFSRTHTGWHTGWFSRSFGRHARCSIGRYTCVHMFYAHVHACVYAHVSRHGHTYVIGMCIYRQVTMQRRHLASHAVPRSI